MKTLLIALPLLLSVAGCGESMLREAAGMPHSCSMVELLATGRARDGDLVSTSGFGSFGSDGNYLFLSALDAEHWVFKNSLAVDFGDDVDPDGAAPLSGKYITITGTFDSDYRGHMSVASGGISDVRSVSLVGGEGPGLEAK